MITNRHSLQSPVDVRSRLSDCKNENALNRIPVMIRFMHNRPSGDPTPSQADIQMTKAIVDIAAPLGIAVHDHIIVGKNGHASLKGLKLI
jgi:DNA repair protein RadC